MQSNFKTMPAGSKFGRLTITGNAVMNERGHRRHECVCVCGTKVAVSTSHLNQGRVQSCGCLGRESRKTNTLTHGLCEIPEYKVWEAMKRRCFNAADEAYHRYGGRGITVCPQWMDFATFYRDVGDRPFERATIERIDNSGNYEPGNIRWATYTEQARNRRSNRLVEFSGRQMTVAEASLLSGIKPQTICWRLDQGWSASRVFGQRLRRRVA